MQKCNVMCRKPARNTARISKINNGHMRTLRQLSHYFVTNKKNACMKFMHAMFLFSIRAVSQHDDSYMLHWPPSYMLIHDCRYPYQTHWIHFGLSECQSEFHSSIILECKEPNPVMITQTIFLVTWKTADKPRSNRKTRHKYTQANKHRSLRFFGTESFLIS